MKYTIRTSTLSSRGRANIQVHIHTRDEIRRLAAKFNISQGVMVERLVKAWNKEERRVELLINQTQTTQTTQTIHTT